MSGRTFRDQLTRRFLIEKSDGIHGGKRRRQFAAVLFGYQRPPGPFIRETLASVFSARISTSPSDLACPADAYDPGAAGRSSRS